MTRTTASKVGEVQQGRERQGRPACSGDFVEPRFSRARVPVKRGGDRAIYTGNKPF